jgi:alpha-glucoside transport system substrate-binding protein
MVRGFEEKYDNRIHVVYLNTRDAGADLANDIQNGNPPDLAVLPNPGAMRQYALKGYLYPIDGALNLQTMNSQYSPYWRQLMQASGPSGTAYYAVVVKAALKSVIWYDPNQLSAPYRDVLTSGTLTWDQLMSLTEHLGPTPWCIGLADGSSSGWPGTDWIEDIVLHQSGLQVYDEWWKGQLPWTSAEIKEAWQAFGQVAAKGTPSELTTSYQTVGQSLFTNPPGCYLDHEGPQETLSSSNSSGPQPGAGFNFIPFPSLTPTDSNNLEVGGDLLGMTNPTPAAEKFVAYLTTPQAQEAWISLYGSGAISVNEAVPLDDYPDPASRHIAQILRQSANVRFDASDSMPSTMSSAFESAVLQYIDNPRQLPAILVGLDQVQRAAYPQDA